MLDVMQVLTAPYHPQANGIEERNTGGECLRHLRALVELPEAREKVTLVAPFAQRIVNGTYRDFLGCCPNDLVYLTPPSGLRGLFEPFRQATATLPITTEFLKELREIYERMLDRTSLLVLERQEQLGLAASRKRVIPLAIGDLVLVRYPVRPPSKLHFRVAGPFRVVAINRNMISVKDLTCDRVLMRDAEDLIRFRQPVPMSEADLIAVAARDLGELTVVEIFGHRGRPSQRTFMEFQVKWSDGDVTWEPWAKVKKLAALEEYLADQPTLQRLKV
jgi:hypothetical protein